SDERMSPSVFNQPTGASPDSRLSTSNHKNNFSPSPNPHHPSTHFPSRVSRGPRLTRPRHITSNTH
ncbi:hypothetical protein N7513_011635, partial [Penicillium frequentans]